LFLVLPTVNALRDFGVSAVNAALIRDAKLSQVQIKSDQFSKPSAVDGSACIDRTIRDRLLPFGGTKDWATPKSERHLQFFDGEQKLTRQDGTSRRPGRCDLIG
jgi:hypothetical protein